jgi:hypothetical protein
MSTSAQATRSIGSPCSWGGSEEAASAGVPLEAGPRRARHVSLVGRARHIVGASYVRSDNDACPYGRPLCLVRFPACELPRRHSAAPTPLPCAPGPGSECSGGAELRCEADALDPARRRVGKALPVGVAGAAHGPAQRKLTVLPRAANLAETTASYRGRARRLGILRSLPSSAPSPAPLVTTKPRRAGASRQWS